MKTASWVIRRKSDGLVIAETFNPRIAESINVALYEAIPILEYLESLNFREQRA